MSRYVLGFVGCNRVQPFILKTYDQGTTLQMIYSDISAMSGNNLQVVGNPNIAISHNLDDGEDDGNNEPTYDSSFAYKDRTYNYKTLDFARNLSDVVSTIITACNEHNPLCLCRSKLVIVESQQLSHKDIQASVKLLESLVIH